MASYRSALTHILADPLMRDIHPLRLIEPSFFSCLSIAMHIKLKLHLCEKVPFPDITVVDQPMYCSTHVVMMLVQRVQYIQYPPYSMSKDCHQLSLPYAPDENMVDKSQEPLTSRQP